MPKKTPQATLLLPLLALLAACVVPARAAEALDGSSWYCTKDVPQRVTELDRSPDDYKQTDAWKKQMADARAALAACKKAQQQPPRKTYEQRMKERKDEDCRRTRGWYGDKSLSAKKRRQLLQDLKNMKCPGFES